MSQNKDNLIDVLRTLFRWKKPIVYLCLAAGVISAIVVMIVPVYYQAATVFFVVSPDQSKPELMFGNTQLEPELYGNESDIDRLLTIAESNELVEFLIDSFQLYRHYNIDTAAAKAPYYVKLKFFDLYEVEKTKRDAIQLSVEDRDREIARQMTRAAREKINSMAQELIKAAQEKKIRTYENSIQSKMALIRAVGDSLVQLRSTYGIFNVLAQSEILTSELTGAEGQLAYTRARLQNLEQTPQAPRDSIIKLRSIVAGLEEQRKTLNERLDLFNRGVAEVNIYDSQYKEATQALSEEQERLKQYRAAYQSNIPALILVEEAELPIIKSRPRRTLIVLASVVIAFFFGLFGVLIFDNYRDINWREIYHGR